MMFRVICLAHLMVFLHATNVAAFLNGLGGTILDGQRWIVLKEEIVAPVNDTVLQRTVLDYTKNSKIPVLDYTKNSQNDTSEKDRSLFTCENITLKMGEYDIYDNGTLHVKAFRKTLNSSFYIENGDKTVTICKPTKGEHEPISTLVRVILTIVTFAYTLITLLSAMCTFSKNSTYLQLALVSWVCVASNIFLWMIVMVIIPGNGSVFRWVSISVNMNQSMYLTSAWMALLTSHKALKYLQEYGFIQIFKREVTVRVYWIGSLCIVFSAIVASANFVFNKINFFGTDPVMEGLFCNLILYATLFMLIFAETFLCPSQNNLTDVSRDYQEYHHSLCVFSIFHFSCIALGTVAVVYEMHVCLWIYTLCNFTWPLCFLDAVIPRVQTLIAIATEDDEEDEKVPICSEKVPLNKENNEKEFEM